MLLFTQLAIFSLFLYQPIYGLLTNCLNGAPCDCDPDVIDYWEGFEFTTPELFTTTMILETTENLMTTLGNTTTSSIATTMEMLETTINEETTENIVTTESPTTTTTGESIVTEMLETTINEETTTEIAEETSTTLATTETSTTVGTSTMTETSSPQPTTEALETTTTEIIETTNQTPTESFPTTEIPSTIQFTSFPSLPTNPESTPLLLTTENIQTTNVELKTVADTTVESTTPSTSTIMPTTTIPCSPCTVGQSLVLYDKNILNSNQSINNVPASRCDNCNQSTISQICYNPRVISVVRVRCTNSKLFCACASNQKVCYTVTQNAPLYVADYLIYANASYSFLALNTGASEISNGKKTYDFQSNLPSIPNDKNYLNAPFLSVSCSGCDAIRNPINNITYTC
ncbi:hypothetical protein ACQ4LE_010367 [Meloidogyne hapla]|uniref:Uncharacterized protein n=1 Tax=Meloidogyne hapla TaxID=6305 RepID=A0A1I8BMY3_MELHA